ncbi:MAG: protein phosphatase 2C domain-containing protein [Candidatus Eisenbacteria bacterium]
MSDKPEVQPMTTTPFVETGIATSRVHADIAALTHQGARPNNEDAYVVYRLGRFMECVSSNLPKGVLPARYDDSGHLMIVGDGVGGAASGEVASRTAMLTLVHGILRSPKWALKLDDPDTREGEIQELIARSRAYLQQMHEVIRERQEQDPRYEGMGTTFTSAYTVGGDLFITHVGDSRAYVLRAGRLFRITRDHTLAQEYADLGRLRQAEVEKHPLGHVLTRALGGPTDILESDTHHRDVEDGDRLLLCSDGLTKVASEADISAAMMAHASSEAACRALVDLALARGGPDNITVIVAGYQVS